MGILRPVIQPIIRPVISPFGQGGGSGPDDRPKNTVPPSIIGDVEIGETVEADTGTWVNADSISYEWRIDGSPVGDPDDDLAIPNDPLLQLKTLTLVVTATNANGSRIRTASQQIALTLAPINSVPAAITGDAEVGALLTAVTGTWLFATSVTGEWYSGATPTGETGLAYTVLESDEGDDITYVETATNVIGSTQQASNAIEIPGGSLTAQVQALFAKYSAKGGMWDFTDTATLFQDSAGATPVTASTQPVGKVNDISGQGNHLNQPTSAARPQYNGAGITPDGVDDFLVTAGNLDLSACDKVVVAMGYTKVDDVQRMQMEFPTPAYSNAGGLWIISYNSPNYQASYASGTAIGTAIQEVGFATARPNEYGAHIARHSIPGDLSEVWWNGTKAPDNTADKGSGNFGDYVLNLLARNNGLLPSNTPARRALVLGVPVAGPQVSDADVELIRQWLVEGVA